MKRSVVAGSAMTNKNEEPKNARLSWLERPGEDFPFYRGQPVSLSAVKWLVVLVAVAAGFACLTVDVPILTSDLGIFIRTLLFPAIPLVALRIMVGAHWRCLFRRVRRADVGWMLGFAVLNLLVSTLVGWLIMTLFGAEANAAVVGLAGLGASERGLFFLRTVPQLFGEEVLTVLPFLAILSLAHDRLNLSRGRSLLLAWLLSSILFGLVHLPSYNWNLLQCLLIIGSARLVLSLAYIKTKNIWVSTGAHIINDWAIFSVVILGSAAKVVG
ncbi:CPBP family intramembrane glutamic endopeptidase [Alcanivorax hongdengensis]|nr:CPBP family intramembrane glutamic endopeptidase [Alcanivorax hongdengensis]